MTAHTAPNICAIYGDFADGSGGKFLGGGTLIGLGDRTWVLTANHVLYERNDPQYRVIAVSQDEGTEPYVLGPEFFGWAGVLDLGAVPLGSDYVSASKRPVPAGRLGKNSRGVEEGIFFVQGFPPPPEATPRSSFPSIVGSRSVPVLTGPAAVRNIGWFDPRRHFALDYSGSDLVHGDGGHADWKQPRGFSGSAVWAVNGGADVEGWTPDRSRIVGVVTDHGEDDQVLVAVRIEIVRKFLRTTLCHRFARRSCADLRALLSLW